METDQEKRPKVIIFNGDKRIVQFGNCRIALDIGPKQLCMKFDDSTTNGPDLFLSFHRRFIAVENFLCVIDDDSGYKVGVVVPNKLLCQKLYTRILQEKFQHSAPQNPDSAEDEAFFKQEFFIPILKEIQHGIPNFEELKTVILECINSFEGGIKKEGYFNLALEVSLCPIPTTNAIEMEQQDTLDDENLENSTMNETSGSCYSLRKRKLNVSYKESQNEAYSSLQSNGRSSASSSRKAPLKGKRYLPMKRFSNTIIKKPDFEMIYKTLNGRTSQRLLIFESSNRSNFYEYYVDNIYQVYRCYACRKLGTSVIAKLINDDIVQLGVNPHKCKAKQGGIPKNEEKMCLVEEKTTEKNHEVPKKPEKTIDKRDEHQLANKAGNDKKSRIVKKPDFELLLRNTNGKISPRLIVFDSTNRNLCYEYYFEKSIQGYRCNECKSIGKSAIARLVKTANEEDDYVVLGKNAHECSKKEYIPQAKNLEKFKPSIVEKGDFQIVFVKRRRIVSKRLVIIEVTNRTLCHEYYERRTNFFNCCGCLRIGQRTSAKLIKPENEGEEFLELGINSHICDLRPYEPQKYFSEENAVPDS